MNWPSKDPGAYVGRGSITLRWVPPAMIAAVAAVLAVALSDLVAGRIGLLLGAVALLAPFPLVRRQGRSWTVSAAAVLLAVVLAVALISVALHALLGHLGDARRWG